MVQEYFAHSENDLGIKHKLSEHLHQTAKLMESFACNHYKKIFRTAGLLHDLGKYQPEFQNYLANGGKRGSVPHSSWGAGYARLCRVIEASILATCFNVTRMITILGAGALLAKLAALGPVIN